MAMVVDDATVISLDDRRQITEERWPVGWTVVLATTLSIGLWGAIFLAIRSLVAIFGAV